MANENVFTKKAADYAAGRPSYAPEAIDCILTNMIQGMETAADVGSGTGIFAYDAYVKDLQELLDRCFREDTFTVTNQTILLWG